MTAFTCRTRWLEHWDIVDRMLELGFDYSQEQVEAAQRKTGVFAGVGNYVFFRR